MRKYSLYIGTIAVLTIIVLTTGCIDSGSSGGSVGASNIGDIIEGEENGVSYLAEGNSETLFTIDIAEGQFLIELVCILNWVDEDPIDNRIREYVNTQDVFTVTLSNGDDIRILETEGNPIDGPGVMYVEVPADVVDNQTISRPMTFTVEVNMMNAGDQYPRNYISESEKVIDKGNDYTWKVIWGYVEKK